MCDGGVMQRSIDAYANMSAQLGKTSGFHTCWTYDPSFPLDQDFGGGLYRLRIQLTTHSSKGAWFQP